MLLENFQWIPVQSSFVEQWYIRKNPLQWVHLEQVPRFKSWACHDFWESIVIFSLWKTKQLKSNFPYSKMAKTFSNFWCLVFDLVGYGRVRIFVWFVFIWWTVNSTAKKFSLKALIFLFLCSSSITRSLVSRKMLRYCKVVRKKI